MTRQLRRRLRERLNSIPKCPECPPDGWILSDDGPRRCTCRRGHVLMILDLARVGRQESEIEV